MADDLGYEDFEDFDFGEAPDAYQEFDDIGVSGNRAVKSMPVQSVPSDDGVDISGDIAQHMMLSYLTANPDLWIHCSPLLKAELFDPEFQPVVSYLREYEGKHGKMPSPLMIHAETGIRLESPENARDEDVFEEVSQKVEKFTRHRALFQMLVDASEKISPDSEDQAYQVLEAELKDILNMRLSRDMGFEVHNAARSILKQAEKYDGISTGLTHLDQALDGGVTMPSFNIVSAGSGDGKSIFLQNMAVKYAQMGYNVVFYSLELEPAMIEKRFAAMMTNTAISLVYREIEAVSHAMETQAKKHGKIWLHKLPMDGTTVADIRAHYNSLCLQSQLDWTVVIIDYLDIMDPVREVRADNIHLKDKYVSQEVNDFAHDPRCLKIVWSASQQTKGAEEEKEARKGAVAGGKDKVSTCDNLFIFKRTLEDQQEERTWMHIQKARSSGAKGMKIPIHWNSETQLMSDGPDDLFIEANPFKFQKKGMTFKSGKSDRISNDAVMKDQPASGLSGKARSGESNRAFIQNRFDRFKRNKE